VGAGASLLRVGAVRKVGRTVAAVLDWPLTLGELLVDRAARARRGRRVLLPLALVTALVLLVFFVTWALSPIE